MHAQQRGLPQIGGLAAHVRAGQDDQLAASCRSSVDVVGHERAAAGDGRAVRRPDAGRRATDQLVAVVHVRLGVVVDGGDFGQRGEHVERGERARGRLNPRRFGGDRARAARSKISSSRSRIRSSAPEHLLFVFLQRRRDEALAAGDRLLAVIVGRHGVQVRLRDLDVVAEHAVVADLQRRDAGARALALFHLGDDLLARSADRAAARRARGRRPSRVKPPSRASAGGSSTSVALDVVAHVRRDRRARRASDCTSGACRSASTARTRGMTVERLLRARRDRAGPAVPSAARASSRSRSCTALMASRNLPRSVVRKRQLLDGVEPIANRLERHQRAQQPRRAAGGCRSRSSCDRFRRAAIRRVRRPRLR